MFGSGRTVMELLQHLRHLLNITAVTNQLIIKTYLTIEV